MKILLTLQSIYIKRLWKLVLPRTMRKMFTPDENILQQIMGILQTIYRNIFQSFSKLPMKLNFNVIIFINILVTPLNSIEIEVLRSYFAMHFN